MKPLVHYEDRPNGKIARVSKYKHIQNGKKVCFDLPEFPSTLHRVSVFLWGTQLVPEVDYHFYWGKLFVHQYVPSRAHVYIVVTEEQEEKDGKSNPS